MYHINKCKYECVWRDSVQCMIVFFLWHQHSLLAYANSFEKCTGSTFPNSLSRCAINFVNILFAHCLVNKCTRIYHHVRSYSINKLTSLDQRCMERRKKKEVYTHNSGMRKHLSKVP